MFQHENDGRKSIKATNPPRPQILEGHRLIKTMKTKMQQSFQDLKPHKITNPLCKTIGQPPAQAAITLYQHTTHNRWSQMRHHADAQNSWFGHKDQHAKMREAQLSLTCSHQPASTMCTHLWTYARQVHAQSTIPTPTHLRKHGITDAKRSIRAT